MDHAACSRSPGPRASGVFCPLCYLLELLVGVAHAGCCVPTRPRQVNEFENRTENDHLSITRARGSRQRRAPVQFRHGTLLGGTHATSGHAAVQSVRSRGRALKQQRVRGLSFSGVHPARG